MSTAYDEYPGYEKFQDEAGEWRWHQVDDNNRIIASSGEGFTREEDVDRAVANVVEESAEAAEG
jgi:uncharacterized protein YegP (UPF0339 family)